MTLSRRVLFATLALAGLAGANGAALAQAYPSKQINIIVSFPPGGDTDALARVFAEKLAPRVGQSVVVENRTGASGTIGNAYVAKAPADGYTLLFTPNTFATAPLVLKPGTGAVYDPLTDTTPIVLAGTQSLFVVANTGTGAKTMGDLLAQMKDGRVKNYASPGTGSPMHILGAMFNKAAGVNVVQVPYRGSGPAIIELVGGQIPMMYTTLGPVAQHIAAGKLVNLAVADPQRSPLAPQVPTLAEAGIRGVEVGAWQGFMGPKGLPAEVVRVINGHVNEILKMPDVLARMTTLALVPAGGAPEALARINADHHSRYGRVIKEAGIQAD
ncbi:MAG: tripartite tricarboxylate transporter substrate binding protein [Burkholderiales bacterium]|nr:tripartite tricarboxylate transporter substrate binding protein [Burkholderiales bacterium]